MRRPVDRDKGLRLLGRFIPLSGKNLTRFLATHHRREQDRDPKEYFFDHRSSLSRLSKQLDRILFFTTTRQQITKSSRKTHAASDKDRQRRFAKPSTNSIALTKS
jgi:hypothetical protein